MCMQMVLFYCGIAVLQVPNFKEIIEGLKEILKLIYGEQAPAWILPLTGYLLLGGLLLIGLLGLLTLLSKIKDVLTDKFWPLFYNKEKVRRSSRRRRFADHIESELRRLNNLEAWSDYRFTELEAEVDAEGRRRLFGVFPSFYRANNTLRRERSLSKALESSDERLIIVEGDPGSGKSVALRHVASMLALRAMKSRSAKSIIPIYVNLKEIERGKSEAIDRNLIASFVLKVLNRVNDRDIEEFLDEEFNQGLQNGAWFFLFDSFDEIPEVLSSTEADKTVTQYATAISHFLHGLNQCRGIIASRFFHGPKQFGWPRFNILPLSSNRRAELVKKANLKHDVETELIRQLETAGQEVRSMASNPMFLGLLCEHMRSGYAFPENSHSVFETYVSSRLNRDEERLYKRFRLKPLELRSTAEAVAFCMAADAGLGLSPSRLDITTAAQKLQINLDKRLNKILDAITYLKLARADTSTTTDKSDQFTFAHRRFQEYFSTAVVLREPDRITPTQLLLDARWRETAVVLCQTQTGEALLPLIKEAESLVRQFNDLINEQHSPTNRFQWPAQALHVMGLLQEGFTKRLSVLPEEVRVGVGNVLIAATKAGISADKKWALDVSGIAPTSVLIGLLRNAFGHRSQVLRDSAYRQVARLNEIPSDLAYRIKATLCTMTIRRRLRKERSASHAHLSRLDDSSDYLATLRLLIWLPIVDFGLHTALFFAALIALLYQLSPLAGNNTGIAVAVFLFTISIPVSYTFFYWPVWFSVYILDFALVEAEDDEKANLFGQLFLLVNPRFVLSLCIAGLADAILSLMNESLKWPYRMWLPALIMYMSMWAPSALFLARRSGLMNPLFWPFFPFLTILKSAKAFLLVFVSLVVKDWRAFLKEVLAPWLPVYVLILFCTAGGVFAPEFMLAPIALVFIVLVSYGLYLLFLQGKDILRWRRWTRNKPNAISTHEFIDTVRIFKTERYRVRFINAVRTKGLLMNSDGAEETIYTFVKELEMPRPYKRTHNSWLSSVTWSIAGKIKQSFPSLKERNENYLYGVAVLDEVLRLLEQVRATR